MIIFDEISYARNIIRNGCSKRNVLVDFKILAKYYLFYENKTDQETKEAMLAVLKNSQTFIPINYLILKIDKAISYAKTEQIKTTEEIPIFKEELEVIKALPTEVQDMAFIYLFLSKWSKDEKGFFVKEADIKKLMGKQSIRNRDLQIMNKTLEDAGFIKFVDTRTKELIKVLAKQDNGLGVFSILDFEHPILYFKKYLGEKIGNCLECDCLIKITSSNNKYCKNCKRLVKNRQTKKSKHKND